MTLTLDLSVIKERFLYVDVKARCFSGTALLGELDAIRGPRFLNDMRVSVVNSKLG